MNCSWVILDTLTLRIHFTILIVQRDIKSQTPKFTVETGGYNFVEVQGRLIIQKVSHTWRPSTGH